MEKNCLYDSKGIKHTFVECYGRRFLVEVQRRPDDTYSAYCVRFRNLIAFNITEQSVILDMKFLIETQLRKLLEGVVRVIDAENNTKPIRGKVL